MSPKLLISGFKKKKKNQTWVSIHIPNYMTCIVLCHVILWWNQPGLLSVKYILLFFFTVFFKELKIESNAYWLIHEIWSLYGSCRADWHCFELSVIAVSGEPWLTSQRCSAQPELCWSRLWGLTDWVHIVFILNHNMYNRMLQQLQETNKIRSFCVVEAKTSIMLPPQEIWSDNKDLWRHENRQNGLLEKSHLYFLSLLALLNYSCLNF